MDWDDLRVFLAVARTESLSAAGKRLKIDCTRFGSGAYSIPISVEELEKLFMMLA